MDKNWVFWSDLGSIFTHFTCSICYQLNLLVLLPHPILRNFAPSCKSLLPGLTCYCHHLLRCFGQCSWFVEGYIWPQIMSSKTSDQHFILLYSLQISIEIWVCVREISGVEKFWRKFSSTVVRCLLFSIPTTDNSYAAAAASICHNCLALCLFVYFSLPPLRNSQKCCKFLWKSLTKFPVSNSIYNKIFLDWNVPLLLGDSPKMHPIFESTPAL